MNIKNFLLKKSKKALTICKISETKMINICYTNRKKFGDYQINGIISIAKKKNQSPYKLAKKIKLFLNFHPVSKKIEITKNGFINIFLNKKWIEKEIEKTLKNQKLITTSTQPKKIIIDYSSPNIAKQMHVGHLRSTIIGDSMVRTLEFLGHHVIKANHIGNWGTPFGMLIAYFKKKKIKIKNNTKLSDLEKFYKKSRKHYEKNQKFSNLAKKFVVKLQSKNKKCHKIWKKLTKISISENQKIYKLLNIKLKKKDIMGEDLYNKMLPKIISDLIKKKIAVKNEGAIVTYIKEKKKKKNKKTCIIIKKSDGAYLYTTTDIACLKYRCQKLKADRIIYYVDSRQKMHFKQILNISKKAGYISKKTEIEHHILGMILGKDKKPFKSRSGKTIHLVKFIEKGIKKTYNFIQKKNKKIKKNELKSIILPIAIGSIKYADLSKNRKTDYIFNWNKMLNLKGNTSLYIQYAYVRISSILKKEKIKINYLNKKIILKNKCEENLAISLLQFEEIILSIEKNGFPHVLCNYLFKTTCLFSKFYEKCNISKEKKQNIKESRLNLILLTKKILKTGLKILGIKTVKKI